MIRKKINEYKTVIFEGFDFVASQTLKKHWKPFLIMSTKEMVDYIVTRKCSVSRFGDGELQIIAYGVSLKFQRKDHVLRKRLIEVAKSNEENLLICLPNRLNIIADSERKKISSFWAESLNKHLYSWSRVFSKKRCYGDTNISRLTELSEFGSIDECVNYIKKIWENRNVLVVEGKYTRFGVGNSLLDNTKTIHRILCPAESAFDKYSEILSSVINYCIKENETPLCLLALGPTATVLAYDLNRQGIQAIDIGHLDISYEKTSNGYLGAVPGKYTNEADGGNNVGECTDMNYYDSVIGEIY